MKLFIATKRFDVLIAAESLEAAQELALGMILQEIQDNYDMGEEPHTTEILCLDDVCENWRDSIPRNNKENRTCREILKESKA